MEINEHIHGIISNLPETPGCYQFLNDQGTIIYVGKAKNLKRRVNSYFHNPRQTAKTAQLVRHICDIKYIVVNTEEDALLLENNLIKQWNPRYNILLKDGKTYPSIVVTNEPFPRIFHTRRINKRTGTYFGPYSHVPTMQLLLQIIKKLYPLRTCNTPMLPERIEQGKYRECLDYHIHNCAAPCIAKVSREKYNQWMAEAMEILRGNTRQIEQQMMQEMKTLAEEMRFEEAEAVKQRYLILDNYRSKSEVVSNVLHNIDVYNIEVDDRIAYVNYLHVSNGCITQAFTFEIKKSMDESEEELLVLGIGEMRERYPSKSPEIILPFHVELELDGVTFTIPQRGDKKKLLGLSKLNVMQYKKDRLQQADKLNPEQKGTRLMMELQKALQLPTLPKRIECFDNSNSQGTDAVAACVVFDMGRPNKKEYRKYNIKTVIGPDDYASMKEVVRRRYTRIRDEEGQMPDLVITDGGRGQMEVVREVVEDELGLHIPIAGLAKDSHHRTNELLFGFPPQVVGLKTDSQLFHLLTQIQDEVHRFAITFHRDKRSKHQLASELDNIKGIGEKTKQLLLKHFHSVKRIKEATEAQLAEVIGTSKARTLTEHFSQATD